MKLIILPFECCRELPYVCTVSYLIGVIARNEVTKQSQKAILLFLSPCSRQASEVDADFVQIFDLVLKSNIPSRARENFLIFQRLLWESILIKKFPLPLRERASLSALSASPTRQAGVPSAQAGVRGM